MVALPQRIDIREDEGRPGATIICLDDHRIAAFGATGNAELALAYHQRGVRVFPCREDRFGPSDEHPKGDPEAKKPYPGIMWQGPEPSRRASIERWWRDWPDALIGVGLGERNLLVIDVDGGAAGVAAWEAYALEQGGLPDDTPVVVTPTGGRHYFFRLPDGVIHGNGRGALPKKAELPVDVRGGKSGYVIAAGTDRAFQGLYRPDNGDTFAWLDAPLIPDWLLEVLQGKRQHDDAPPAPAPRLPAIITTPADHEHPRVRAWVEAAFKDEIEGVATCPPGGRNEQLNKAAFAIGQFVPHYLAEAQAVRALEQAADACGLWKDDGAVQCRKTISSGLNSGMREPRQIPANIREEIEMDRFGAEIRRTLIVQPDGGLLHPETGEFTNAPAKVTEEEFPEHLTYVPGLLGEITDFIYGSARRPSRSMALAAAIAVVGTAMGRTWAGPTKSGTHNYILTIAPTGAGKDHPMQQARTILEASGMQECVGPDGFTASSAVTSLMLRRPLTLATIDEFGAFLKRINSRRAGGYEKDISKTLRTLWGVNYKSFRTQEWAGKPSETVYAPALSIAGTTTTSEFFKSLEGADVGNGFLNRFLLVYVSNRPQDVEPSLPDDVVPEPLLEGIGALWGCGDVKFREVATGQASTQIKPNVVPWEDEAAQAVYRLLCKTIELMGEERPETIDFFARTAEMAVRLATIRAAGRDPFDSPAVSVADMEWGRDVAMHSARRMMECCALYMAETENQEWANNIKRIIREAGGKMRTRDMLRKLQHKLKGRDLKDLLAAMQASGTIVIHAAQLRKGDTFATPEMVELLD